MLLPMVAIAAGGLIAACGSASSSSSSSSTSSTTSTAAASASNSNPSARRAQLVACLKSHGVTLPSRPAGSGGGSAGSGTGTTGTGTTPRRFFFGGGGGFAANPKVRAALQACGGANFRGGQGFRGQISHTRIDNYVACVRKNGYDMPNPNFSGKGPIFPANIQSNPKFQAASKKCQSLLIRPRPSGGTSTTSGA